MVRRSKSNELSRRMIAEIIFIETAPAYLHPFALISFVSGFGGTRREDLRYYIEQKWKEKTDELIQEQGIDDFTPAKNFDELKQAHSQFCIDEAQTLDTPDENSTTFVEKENMNEKPITNTDGDIIADAPTPEPIKTNNNSLFILKPSLLIGKRKNSRFIESIGQIIMPLFSYLLPQSIKAVKASTVAKCMLELSKSELNGINIIEDKKILSYK